MRTSKKDFLGGFKKMPASMDRQDDFLHSPGRIRLSECDIFKFQIDVFLASSGCRDRTSIFFICARTQLLAADAIDYSSGEATRWLLVPFFSSPHANAIPNPHSTVVVNCRQ
jgi:hypothetical protein